MAKKIDFKELRTFHYNDFENLIKKLKEYLNDDELAPEQKLFCAGYILNKNKEYYIMELKHERDVLQAKLNTYLENERNTSKLYRKEIKKSLNAIICKLDCDYKPFKTTEVKIEAPKKKVIIIKKKKS